MRKITVVPYDKQWPQMFESERSLLQTLPDEIVKAVHHIGSTSVPGLAAKPVIDILLEVVGLDALDECHSLMVQAGYSARGENGIPGRRYFTKGDDRRSHQVHAFAVGDKQIVKHLAFRDYLIKNREAAEQYAEIKRAAVLASHNDAHRYSELKTDFIAHHLQIALAGL